MYIQERCCNTYIVYMHIVYVMEWEQVYLASNWTILLVLALSRIRWPQFLQRTGSVLESESLLEHSAQMYFKVAVLLWAAPAAAASKFVGIWKPSRDILTLTLKLLGPQTHSLTRLSEDNSRIRDSMFQSKLLIPMMSLSIQISY